MNRGERPRVAVVVPELDADTASHFFHFYELLSTAADKLDITVVAERALENQLPSGLHAIRQRFHFPPLRFLELVMVLFSLRLRGARYFYVHYSLYGGVAAWVVAHFTGARTLYWNCGMPWRYRRSWFAERLLRFTLRRNTLVTGTPGLAAEYASRYQLRPDDIRVMPNWINLRRFGGSARREAREALAIPSEDEVILFVHRLSRRKGAHLLPDIASYLTISRPRATLYIVGAGPLRKTIESELRSRGLADRTRFAGAIPNKDIAHFFLAADVFLMPSEEEGFPRVLLEAMAAGLPYVASLVGGVAEITPPALVPFLVRTGDPAEFAKSVITILSLPPVEQAAIRDAERAWVRRYDLPMVVGQFINLFS